MKIDKLEAVSVFPVVIAIIAVCLKSVWLCAAVVPLIFILVFFLPYCRRRENLWVFVWTGLCALPINWFILTYFPMWKEYLFDDRNKLLLFISVFEYVLIFTGVEELFMGLICRMLFKRQYKLWIPLTETDAW